MDSVILVEIIKIIPSIFKISTINVRHKKTPLLVTDLILGSVYLKGSISPIIAQS